MPRSLKPQDNSGGFSRLCLAISHLPLAGDLCGALHARGSEVKRFVKFSLVGALGAVVDFTVLNLVKWLFEATGVGEGLSVGIEPRQLQLIGANTISFSIAVLSNFTWNRLWTFPESRERPLGKQLAQFAVVNLIGLGINTLLLVVLDRFVFRSMVSDRLSYNLAKAVAIGAVLFWNFGMNRLWTYRGIR